MKRQRLHKFVLRGIYFSCFIAGIIDQPPSRNGEDYRNFFLIGFFFFSLFVPAGAMFGKWFYSFTKSIRRIATSRASTHVGLMVLVTIYGIAGFVLTAFGLGSLISSPWMNELKMWEGLFFLSSGLGLVVGVKLSKRILIK